MISSTRLHWLTCTDVRDEVCNVLLLKELGKETGPVWLHCHTSSLDDGLDVVSLRCRQSYACQSSSTAHAIYHIKSP